jgi:uncharacterized protein (TIGR04141 family)
LKLNIVSISPADVDALRAKLVTSGLTAINEVDQDGWKGSFYYSSSPAPVPVSWAKPFESFFLDGKKPFNLSYFATFVFTKGERCYALSYSKAHFYLRPFCNYDFGVDIAKRIANDGDTRQAASRRYEGRRKKNIKSFAYNTALDVESGESVDYLQATISQVYKVDFGKTGRFGSSVLLTPEVGVHGIGDFLDKLDAVLTKPAKFKLPRTDLLSSDEEVARYDEKLIDELLTEVGESELAQNTYDQWGRRLCVRQ